jgi:hypothetical protein
LIEAARSENAEARMARDADNIVAKIEKAVAELDQ